MRLDLALACLLAAIVPSQAADTTVYRDPTTGFIFGQQLGAYKLGGTITFRVAVPSNATEGSPFDAVLQVVAPKDVGWVGLAWGGSMLNDPLTLAWQNGQNVVISSRYATARSQPPAYKGATYTLLKKGTTVNSTHYQYTAKCSGCTYYTGASSAQKSLNPIGGNGLAFAFAFGKATTPSSNTSNFPSHDAHGYWVHDFAVGANTNFAELVKKNA